MKALSQVSSQIVLIPAYGRVYQSKETMLNDWVKGKDFMLRNTGQYTSIRDIMYLKDEASTVSLNCKNIWIEL